MCHFRWETIRKSKSASMHLNLLPSLERSLQDRKNRIFPKMLRGSNLHSKLGIYNWVFITKISHATYNMDSLYGTFDIEMMTICDFIASSRDSPKIVHKCVIFCYTKRLLFSRTCPKLWFYILQLIFVVYITCKKFPQYSH